MKALFISHKPPYPIIDGGCHAMDRMLRDFLFSYPDAEIKYLSIVTEKHPAIKNSAPSDLQKNVKFQTVEIATKINPIAAFIHLFNNKSYHISRFKQDALKECINDLLNNNQFDLIIFESIFSAGYIDHISRESKARLIYRAHNIEHKIWMDLSLGEKNPIKKWYLKHLAQRLMSFELKFLNKIDLVFSISSIDQEFFHENTKTVCKYIPVSMITEMREVEIKNTLCFLGAFNWLPNKEGVLWFVNDILPELLISHPELTLEIAGSFSNEISTLSGKKNINLHGFVESSKEFILNNGIFVAPLLSGSGVKMKVLEAMSLGVPCVVSKNAAEGLNLPSIIPICNSKKEFIEKLSLLLKDKELSAEIGRAGKRFIETDFSSVLVSDKLINALKL